MSCRQNKSIARYSHIFLVDLDTVQVGRYNESISPMDPTVDGSEIPNKHLGCIKPC